jgi:diguanylate cyclase (GGDEF)-like protein/PAS domain S-box-containing protein
MTGTAALGAAVFWVGLWVFDLTTGRPPTGWFLLAFVVMTVLQAVTRGLRQQAGTERPLPDSRPAGADAPWQASTEAPATPPGASPTETAEDATPGGPAMPGAPPPDRQHTRLRQIFDSSNDAIFLVDPADGRILDCNPRAETMLGHDRDTLLQRRLGDFQADEGHSFEGFAALVLEAGAAFSDELHYLASDGRHVPTEISASVLDLDEGRVLLFMVRDISERKLAESRIQHLAYHDTLTDLPNRSLFKDRMQVALARSRRSGDIGALLFLDLDNFKRINDTLGHSVGDRLLQILARRLTGTLRAEDTVARLGGDEFVILVERMGRDIEEAHARIEDISAKLRAAMAQPYHLDGRELHVSGSIGIVTFPQNGSDVDELLRHADVAMYQAKGSGRDTARVFSEDMQRGAVERLELEERLRHALRDGQLALYYQPVMTLRDGRMAGAEALLRWRHEDGALVTATEFLGQVEDPALNIRIADWVLAEAFRTIAALQRTGSLEPPCYVSVNLSPLQFRQLDFAERVRRLLAEAGADPRLVQFEITEQALDHSPEAAADRLQALRGQGIRFAIDDFGTGYSCLANLKGLPLDALKIDRSFIRQVNEDPNDAAIVDSILSLADHFGLSAIAEGVENREQLLFLRARGCQYYQGMLGRPPLSEAEFTDEVIQRAAMADLP